MDGGGDSGEREGRALDETTDGRRASTRREGAGRVARGRSLAYYTDAKTNRQQAADQTIRNQVSGIIRYYLVHNFLAANILKHDK